MGDIDVDFFLGTLKNLITDSKIDYIKEKKLELESLADDIKYLREFLKLTEKKRKEHPEVMDLVVRIRDVISETENIIELFVVRVYKADHSNQDDSVYRTIHDISLADFDVKLTRPWTMRTLLGDAIQWVAMAVIKRIILREQARATQTPRSPMDDSNQDDLSLDLQSVIKEIMTLRIEVEHILEKYVHDINGVAVIKRKHSYTESEGGPSPSGGRDTYKVSEGREVVGFEDEVRTLMGKLHDSGDGGNLEIISIIGVGGGGKTTLAKEVYVRPLTLQKFEIRAWLNVSQDYNMTMKWDLLISILKSAFPEDHEDHKELNEDKLGEKVYKCLKGKKYLVVMDDIWGLEAWNDIQRSFPRESNQSKVLLTSRQPVKPDSIVCIPHFVSLLSDSCSWELLQKKVFKKGQCPPGLVAIGMQIAKKCKGLPLAIVAIAGILATQDKTINVWEEVVEHLSSIIAKSQEGPMEILELSYNHLPLHLKACFLYIGAHQEDYEIPVKKLIWLWSAEGFLNQTDGGKSLEAIGKDYLVDLIERNLIMVAREDLVGTIQACRIHDLLRELCFKKGKEDNFFVQNYNDDSFSPVTNEHRRLFIGNKLFDKFCSSSSAGNLRSFFCPAFRRGTWNDEKDPRELSFFAESFKLLRVLHMKNFSNFGELRKGELVHLRYLALDLVDNWCRITGLSPTFCNLSNLETLELDFKWGNIVLPLDVFKMVRLRSIYSEHGLYTFHHYSAWVGEILAQFQKNEEDLEILRPYFENEGGDFEIFRRSVIADEVDYEGKGFEILLRYCEAEERENNQGEENKLGSLQILHSICSCKCCLHFLKRAPNLRDLRIVEHGKHKYDLILYNLQFLKCLEILYFKGDFWNVGKGTIELQLPPTITRLALSHLSLKWEHLSTLLQSLPSLEVLKLSKDSITGRFWDTSDLEEGFPQLKYLKLKNLDIEEWRASEDQFPRLEVLVIENCESLEGIPIEFADLYELRQISVRWSTISAEESARQIQEAQKIMKGDDACLNLVAEGNGRSDEYLSGFISDSSMD